MYRIIAGIIHVVPDIRVCNLGMTVVFKSAGPPSPKISTKVSSKSSVLYAIVTIDLIIISGISTSNVSIDSSIALIQQKISISSEGGSF